MEYDSPKRQGLQVADDTEARLRAEIEDLKRKVEEQQQRMQHAPPGPAAHAATPAPPSRRALWLLALVLAILIVIGFLKGYIPHRRNEATLAAEADSASKEVPTVTVVSVDRSATTGTLVLPGNIEAVTEAPVLARASGMWISATA
jgi:ferric-dicitrate binding protein FerR (iron transport regulator)